MGSVVGASYTGYWHLYWFTGRKKGLRVRGWLLQGEEQGTLPISAASSHNAQEKLHGSGGRGEKALERVTVT